MTFRDSVIPALERLIDTLYFFLVKRSSSLQKYAHIIKENELLKRRLDQLGNRVQFTSADKVYFVRLLKLNKSLGNRFTLITPETVLKLWSKQIMKRWKYPHPVRKGRPPVSKENRKWVIRMKQDNPLWGVFRIAGEFHKLDIDISRETVRRIIQKGRKDGDILPTGSWKKFLKSHWDSLFACDFLTVETVFDYRFYIFFLIRLKDRKIMQFGMTKNPTMEFLTNQLKGFLYDKDDDDPVYLIHDNSGEMRNCDYASLGIHNIPTTPYSPNLNAYAERFVRSVRTECLDHFIIMNGRHLRNLMKKYVHYFNHYRPHQGIGNRIPAQSVAGRTDRGLLETDNLNKGEIKSESLLFGLHHHYYRVAS